MCNIWSYVHQMCDALTALALGVALEEFTHLEEEHHKDRFGEFRLSPRQETDAESTNGGNGHEEVLVESITVGDSLPCLVQRLMAYQQIRYEIDK